MIWVKITIAFSLHALQLLSHCSYKIKCVLLTHCFLYHENCVVGLGMKYIKSVEGVEGRVGK